MIEIDFATNQAMGPCWAYAVGLPKHVDIASVIGTANEQHQAAQRRRRLELELLSHEITLRRGFDQSLGASAMRCDIGIGARLQFAQVRHAMPVPDLRLPQRVETLDGVLHAMLKRRYEYGNDPQLQT